VALWASDVPTELSARIDRIAVYVKSIGQKPQLNLIPKQGVTNQITVFR